MTETSLTINLSPSSSGVDDIFVNLEQEAVDSGESSVGLADVSDMLANGLMGATSAGQKDNECPMVIVDGIIYVATEFFAWPSSLGLQFELSPALGEIINKRQVGVSKSFDVIFGFTDVVALDFVLSNFSIQWQTPAYNSSGTVVEHPEVTLEGANIRLSSSVFAVARVTGVAQGYSAISLLTIEKEEGQKITNLQNTITASWIGEKGWTETDQLELEFPECVTDALEMCDNDGPPCRTIFSKVVPGMGPVTAYYSICDGSILDEVPPDDDKKSWCADNTPTTWSL